LRAVAVQKGSIMGEVINLAERPSKAGRVFEPIKPQETINAEELAQQRVSLRRKIRITALVASFVCAGFGFTAGIVACLLLAAFPHPFTRIIKENNDARSTSH
jgi:hypothetical protein